MFTKIRFIAALLAVSLVIVVVSAQSVSGVFKFGRGSIILTGVIRGLGNVTSSGESAVTTLYATVQVTAECRNPAGNIAYGRSPISFNLTASQLLQADRNGQASVFIEIADPTFQTAPVSPSPKEAGCPNGKWTVTNLINPRWQSAEVVVTRAGFTEIDNRYACVDTGTDISCTPS